VRASRFIRHEQLQQDRFEDESLLLIDATHEQILQSHDFIPLSFRIAFLFERLRNLFSLQPKKPK